MFPADPDNVTGGANFTNATLTMALTGDTTTVDGSNGTFARLGGFGAVTGDRISFSLSGGNHLARHKHR